ncbi:heterogeneous nuclear ribonucleoprotein 1-like [Iris pallida]|uniref:Heterogeneous nuclear ribonucleoprotein 1-like n=1 Tax=Iris pallida TaxID=29817 RepID=A0AAX6GYZ3_IRIPA|nr:heterogeneous nuclear ribonucleoprotein 1-like [Iris pallida]KAJ6833752.1 heterogeneous nuclear ribonucleoprotein 1-like [Iris pallida]
MGKFDARANEKDGASPGKIFIGGLPRDTTLEAFKRHFEKYGTIIDHVIMKDKFTSQPRGFGFITFEDPSVVDQVIADTHTFGGKTVEIKRTIPKGSVQSKDFKTKKIFVGGVPTTVTDDELKRFFSKYGKVVEHQIVRDHSTNRSRGFGFVIFDSEEVVDDLLSKGNMIDFEGSQVEIKKAEPKKASNPPPSAFGSEPRGRAFDDGLGGFGNSYSGYGGGGFGPSYRTPGLGGRLSSGGYGGYGGYGASEFGGGYGGSGGIGSYRGESSLGYSSRLGSYGGYGGGYGAGLGGYGHGEESFGSYGGSSYGGNYETGPGAGYSSGGLYGSRGGYGGSGAGRYHPYGR